MKIILLLMALSITCFAQQTTVLCPEGQTISQTISGNTITIKCVLKVVPTPTPTPIITPIPAPTPIPTPRPATPPAIPILNTTGVYASISGVGTGSFESPIDLNKALSMQSPVKAGMTLWLRGGIYTGNFNSYVSGTATNPVIVRAYPNEKVIFNCGSAKETQPNLTINGSDIHFVDLEFSCTGADRTKPFGAAVNVYGARVKIINSYIHDTGGGIYPWTPALDFELYGSIVQRVGYQGAAPDRGHGHSLYTQNDLGTKQFIDNIMFDSYGYGAHAYTEGGSIKGFYFEGNAIFNSGLGARQPDYTPNFLIGGLKPADRTTLVSNFTYQPLNAGVTNSQFFYGARNNDELNLNNNYFVGATEVSQIKEWLKATSKSNTFIGSSRLATIQQPANGVYDFNSNQYITVGTNSAPFIFSKGAGTQTNLTWESFKQITGFESAGSWQQVASLPPKAFIRPNKYEAGRAHVIVYWAANKTVALDLSNVLTVGREFMILNVYDLNTPVLTGVFNGSVVNLSVKTEFAAFLVRYK